MEKANCITINDDEQYKCIDNDNDSEKCWNEKYRGDSRKWLIRDASHKLPSDPICSTMKDSYRDRYNTANEIYEIIGRPRALMIRQFEEEALNEFIKEYNEPPPIEEYCTEYDRSFSMPGFKPDDEVFQRNEEMYKKYPLYASKPTSFYSFKLHNQEPRETTDGFTTVVDKINPFKKTAEFTKPIHEVFDYSSR